MDIKSTFIILALLKHFCKTESYPILLDKLLTMSKNAQRSITRIEPSMLDLLIVFN